MGADGVSIAYLENCTIIGNEEQTFTRGSAIAVLRSNFTLKNCEVIGGEVTGNSVGKSMKDLCDMLDNAIVNNVDASYLGKMLNMMNKVWKAYDLSSWTFNSIKYEQGVWVENKDNQAPVEA